jgi:GST-like protein
LKRWFESIKSRPATVRAYERGAAYASAAPMSDEQRRVLFGQTA